MSKNVIFSVLLKVLFLYIGFLHIEWLVISTSLSYHDFDYIFFLGFYVGPIIMIILFFWFFIISEKMALKCFKHKQLSNVEKKKAKQVFALCIRVLGVLVCVYALPKIIEGVFEWNILLPPVAPKLKILSHFILVIFGMYLMKSGKFFIKRAYK